LKHYTVNVPRLNAFETVTFETAMHAYCHVANRTKSENGTDRHGNTDVDGQMDKRMDCNIIFGGKTSLYTMASSRCFKIS